MVRHGDGPAVAGGLGALHYEQMPLYSGKLERLDVFGKEGDERRG